MLQNDTASLRCEFHECQRAVKAAVNKARGDWMAKVTDEAEAAMTKGSVQRDRMQKLRAV